MECPASSQMILRHEHHPTRWFKVIIVIPPPALWYFQKLNHIQNLSSPIKTDYNL